MSFIDASKLAEFLDDRKNETLSRKSLRNDLALLKRAGLSVPEHSQKFRRRKGIRTLEYFLLRSHLYRSEGDRIVPNRISSNWLDYAKAWRTEVDREEIHIPFMGKIAFLCKTKGKNRLVCHPDSAAIIDKIYVDTGVLTLQRDPVDRKDFLYKSKTCKTILENYRQKMLTEDFLQSVSNTPFGRALISINLARREDSSFKLTGDGLLLTEMKELKGGDELEKVARLILRQEQKKQAQISSVAVCLECLERQLHPSEKPIGTGPKFWRSKRTKKRYQRLGHYQEIEGICSIDVRVATNVLATRGDKSPGFAAFGAILDSYHKVGVKVAEDWVETFAFLSWYTDSLAHLAHSVENLGRRLDWPDLKILKARRHKEFLSRFSKGKSFNVTNRRDLETLQSRCESTEFIDFNIDPKMTPELKGYADVEYCSANVFATSQVPVDRQLLESSVLKILESPSRFKDSQGAFYYPDFRFLVASTIGLSLKSFDQILAYIIAKGSDLGRRLWFFPSFGKVPSRDSPDQQLVDVIGKPFDSIALNY